MKHTAIQELHGQNKITNNQYKVLKPDSFKIFKAYAQEYKKARNPIQNLRGGIAFAVKDSHVALIPKGLTNSKGRAFPFKLKSPDFLVDHNGITSGSLKGIT